MVLFTKHIRWKRPRCLHLKEHSSQCSLSLTTFGIRSSREFFIHQNNKYNLKTVEKIAISLSWDHNIMFFFFLHAFTDVTQIHFALLHDNLIELAQGRRPSDMAFSGGGLTRRILEQFSNPVRLLLLRDIRF